MHEHKMQKNRIYFPGFSFTVPVYEEKDPLQIIGEFLGSARKKFLETPAHNSIDSSTNIDLNTEIESLFEMAAAVYPSPPNIRSIDEILPDFLDALRTMNYEVGTRLDMRNRKLKLVDIAELQSNSDTGSDYDGVYKVGGTCKRYSNGRFLFKVGISDDEGEATKYTVLKCAMHEYGHSLGKRLEPLVFEEVKAYGFEALFYRICEDGHLFRDLDPEMYHDGTHGMAIFKLGELLCAGIPEEAVIAHLINRDFGKFSPHSYLKLMQTKK